MRNQNARQAAWKKEVLTYLKNRAKWEAAEDFCEDRQMKFIILTEDHLGIKNNGKKKH